MYVYQAFRVEDKARLHQFLHKHLFATLVTQEQGLPWATHLPILLDTEKGEYGTLTGHFARANPQRQMLARGAQALAIFQGPHAYISPSWYEVQEHDDAPTWNYAVAHAYGQPRLFDDEQRLYELLIRLITRTEQSQEQPWKLRMSLEEARPQLQGIIGFEMEITRLEGNFKLSQSRSQRDKELVYEHLMRRDEDQDQLLATMMKEVGA